MSKVQNFKQIKRYIVTTRLFSTEPNLKDVTRRTDIIGPPDPVSNLRPIVFAKPREESDLEKKYRQAREDTQLWNQNFWTSHNSSFVQERKEFQESLKAQGKESITADDMSVFYKRFLDKNWQTHFNYNVAWYKKNVKLLCLEMMVRINKLKFK